MAKETMMYFPDYTKSFHLYMDASDVQLRAILMQEDKPIAFFSQKLTNTQKKYGVEEKEMLSIVETLKEFHTIVYDILSSSTQFI